MSGRETIVRADATYDLTVRVGDNIRRGDKISADPDTHSPTAPVSGVVTRIQFDPGDHEFIIVIAHTT